MNEDRKRVLIGLKKANSHIQKIISMIEEDKYCIDIIQQNLAVIGLLKSANLMLLEGHINHCYKETLEGGNCCKIEDMTKELISVIKIAQNK